MYQQQKCYNIAMDSFSDIKLLVLVLLLDVTEKFHTVIFVYELTNIDGM